MSKKWNKNIVFFFIILHSFLNLDVGYLVFAESSKNKNKIQELDSLDLFIENKLSSDKNITQHIEKLRLESERIGYEKGIAKAHFHQANYERKVIQNHTKALESYEKAEAIFNRIPNAEKEKILLAIVKGLSLEALGKYDLALVSYHKGLDFYLDRNNLKDNELKKYQPFIYNNIANVHISLSKYESAEEFYILALNGHKEFDDKENIANALNNLANLYLTTKEFIKAEKFLSESLVIYNELEDTSGIAGIYNNFGGISYHKGELDKALQYFKKTLYLYQLTKDIKNLSKSFFNIGDTYKELDSLEQARFFMEKAILYADSVKANEFLINMYEGLSEVYEKSSDYKNSLVYYKKFKNLSDSLFNLDRQKVIEETTARYNLDQKEHEINEMKNRSYILIGASVAIILALGIALIQSSKKRKALKIIEEKNKELERSEHELKEAQAILKVVNKDLEKLVDQKTTEIQSKNQLLENALQDLNKTLRDLKNAHNLLESIDSNKSQFLGLLSHNFATPITNIAQAIALVDLFIPDEDKQNMWYNDFTETIVKPLILATQKLKDRVYLMQTALSLQNGSRTIFKEITSIDNINTHLDFILNEYHSTCIISKNLVQSEALFEIDDSLFVEIMKIILNNAEDFSRQIYSNDSKNKSNFYDPNNNGNSIGKPQIKLTSKIEDEYLLIEVCDNGRGFSQQALQNFGKLLTPGDDIQNLHEGLGLGIFTAKMIMEEHHGDILAKNNDDLGATVTLKFPISKLTIADL